MNSIEQARWSPAELEYILINDAIRNRLNMNLTTNIFIIFQNPVEFSKRSDVLADFWDLIAPYYFGDKRRMELDKRLDALRASNTEIVNALLNKKEEQKHDAETEIPNELRVKMDAFFKDEHDIYRDVMDLRHEKGLDIGMKKEWTEKERSKTIKSIADENFG